MTEMIDWESKCKKLGKGCSEDAEHCERETQDAFKTRKQNMPAVVNRKKVNKKKLSRRCLAKKKFRTPENTTTKKHQKKKKKKTKTVSPNNEKPHLQ